MAPIHFLPIALCVLSAPAFAKSRKADKANRLKNTSCPFLQPFLRQYSCPSDTTIEWLHHARWQDDPEFMRPLRL